VRSENHTVVYAEALYTNQFKIHTSGFDIVANFSVPAGALRFGADATSVLRFMVEQSGVWTNFVGSNGWDYLSPISGGGPVPRWKGDIFGGWQNQSWEARATLRYTAGYQNSLTNIGITTQKNVASFNAVDLDAEYRGLKNWRFDLSVINVFNH
jgi:outer membrane receptor protein involved in Fe transport